MANPSSPSVPQADVEVITMTADQPAYVDWSAVFAGTAIASAMSMLLYGFGASVGLYVAQPWSHSATTTAGISLAVLIFAALSYIYSLALGSYFAGRMRPRHTIDPDEAQFRDGANGFVVWAISLIVGALIVSNLLVGAGDRAATAGYRTAVGVSSAVAPFAEAAVDNMLRAPVTNQNKSLEPAEVQPNTPSTATTSESSSAPPQAEPSDEPPANDLPKEPTAPASANGDSGDLDYSISDQQREQIGRIVARSLNEGEISKADKQFLAAILESEFGYTPERAMITVNQKTDQAIKETKEFLEEAKANAAFAGFWTTVIVLLSGMASWWAATLGGTHRNEAALIHEN